MKLRRRLRGHALSRCAGRIVAGREKIERKSAFPVTRRRVAEPSRNVDHNNGGLPNAPSGGVLHRTVERAGRGILGERRPTDRKDNDRRKNGRRQNDKRKKERKDAASQNMRATRHRHSPAVVIARRSFRAAHRKPRGWETAFCIARAASRKL